LEAHACCFDALYIPPPPFSRVQMPPLKSSNGLTITHVDPTMMMRFHAAMERVNQFMALDAATRDAFPEPNGVLTEFFGAPTQVLVGLEGSDARAWRRMLCEEKWGVSEEWKPYHGIFVRDADMDADMPGCDYYFSSRDTPPLEIYGKLRTLDFHITAFYFVYVIHFVPDNAFCGKWVDGVNHEYSMASPMDRANVPADVAEFCHHGEGWASLYDDEDEEDEEEPVRKVRYMGGAVAHAAYLALGADEQCCGICHEKRAEHEEARRKEARREEVPSAAAMGGGGGGGGAMPEAPPSEEAAVIKALFVVPLCETHVPHIYHRACLKNWLKRPDHNKCPVCLAAVVREGTPTHSVPSSQVSSLEPM
jgi:hypothetical protein